MSNSYIDELKELLNQYEMTKEECDDILQDYQEMYDNYKDYGMTASEIRSKLGEPSTIINELTEGFLKKSTVRTMKKHSRNNKVTALSPFIALIIFFVLGFAFDLWAYSWMAFLLIPVIAIVSNVERSGEKIIALTPFVATIGYGILGFGYNLWHPGWLIFLIIPVTAILIESRKDGIIPLFTALSPFIALSVFFLYFMEQDMYQTGWLIFLIIPAIGALNEKSVWKMILIETLLLVGVLGYLYIGTTYDRFDLALLSFIPIAIYGILQANIRIWEIPREYRIVVLSAILAFVLLGVSSELVGINMWGWSWLVFLSIPSYSIIREAPRNTRLIALMPFIALTIFFTLGYFLNWWAFSWLAFLLIPMVAIIKEA